jgi:putative phosphoesterase
MKLHDRMQRLQYIDCTAMRIAIVSDIHGNLTAFEAVLADLRQTSPDLVLHGGDLADAGSSPAEIVDRVRDLGWQGVFGNTDEMLFEPRSLLDFAERSPQKGPLLATIEEMSAATREALGEERLAWMRGLPRTLAFDSVALVHAVPDTTWRAPSPEAIDADLQAAYGALGRPVAVYGHIHRSYIRAVAGVLVANSGSVSLSYDGDPRASYLLVDASVPEIRRVEYDVERELKALEESRMPHSSWIARILTSARPQLP